MREEQKRTGVLKAAALRYNAAEDPAPRVTAKGLRKIAEQIIALARENGIPVREDPQLVELLMQVELDDEIPDDLYRAVAEILAFLYRADKRWSSRSGLGS